MSNYLLLVADWRSLQRSPLNMYSHSMVWHHPWSIYDVYTALLGLLQSQEHVIKVVNGTWLKVLYCESVLQLQERGMKLVHMSNSAFVYIVITGYKSAELLFSVVYLSTSPCFVLFRGAIFFFNSQVYRMGKQQIKKSHSFINEETAD